MCKLYPCVLLPSIPLAILCIHEHTSSLMLLSVHFHHFSFFFSLHALSCTHNDQPGNYGAPGDPYPQSANTLSGDNSHLTSASPAHMTSNTATIAPSPNQGPSTTGLLPPPTVSYPTPSTAPNYSHAPPPATTGSLPPATGSSQATTGYTSQQQYGGNTAPDYGQQQQQPGATTTSTAPPPSGSGVMTPYGSGVPAPGTSSAGQGPPKRLHVSNIPFRFREPDLRHLFYVSNCSDVDVITGIYKIASNLIGAAIWLAHVMCPCEITVTGPYTYVAVAGTLYICGSCR